MNWIIFPLEHALLTEEIITKSAWVWYFSMGIGRLPRTDNEFIRKQLCYLNGNTGSIVSGFHVFGIPILINELLLNVWLLECIIEI